MFGLFSRPTLIEPPPIEEDSSPWVEHLIGIRQHSQEYFRLRQEMVDRALALHLPQWREFRANRTKPPSKTTRRLPHRRGGRLRSAQG
jgi:hypothetical protein